MAAQSSDRPQVEMLLLPALNQMIDLANSEKTATRLHPPMVIFVLLALLVLVSSFLAGYAMGAGKSRHWIHAVTFSVVITMTVYVIWTLNIRWLD